LRWSLPARYPESTLAQFEQQRSTVQQQQEEDHKAEALQNSLDEWQQVQNSWKQASSDLKVQVRR